MVRIYVGSEDQDKQIETQRASLRLYCRIKESSHVPPGALLPRYPAEPERRENDHGGHFLECRKYIFYSQSFLGTYQISPVPHAKNFQRANQNFEDIHCIAAIEDSEVLLIQAILATSRL